MNSAIQITVDAVRIDHHGLDPITLIIEDIAPGKGRIIVECCGSAWSAWWGGMGDGRTVVEFVRGLNDDYLAGCLYGETRTFKEQWLRRISAAVIEHCKQQ